ncbi:hypothetical protein [Burkholderia territorii]|uniref:hypothetical protein n=1 Tax=Burkholderia territorii TaxID=1503055 RepID=UPI000B0FBEE7|nr:hypothetical protein [Burkholderia territorii]
MAANFGVQKRYFPHKQDRFKELVSSDILSHAKTFVATSRKCRDVRRQLDKVVGGIVFIGRKHCKASTSDISLAAVKNAIGP